MISMIIYTKIKNIVIGENEYMPNTCIIRMSVPRSVAGYWEKTPHL